MLTMMGVVEVLVVLAALVRVVLAVQARAQMVTTRLRPLIHARAYGPPGGERHPEEFDPSCQLTNSTRSTIACLVRRVLRRLRVASPAVHDA